MARLAPRRHISEDAFRIRPNSVASQSMQNKISSSRVSPGPHRLDPLHLRCAPRNPGALSCSDALEGPGPPSSSSLPLSSLARRSLRCHRSKPSPAFESQFRCQLLFQTLPGLSLKLPKYLIYLVTVIYLCVFLSLHRFFFFLGSPAPELVFESPLVVGGCSVNPQ